jgi:hypothetical protein
MTMHLEGPWLSTTGKKKGKRKFRNADEARKSRQLADDWQDLLKRHGIEVEKKRKNRALTADPYKPLSTEPYRRDTGPRIPSLDPTNMAPCLKAPDKVYTGTLIKGIGTMHKSNAVPIFSDEEAIDIAKMRR